MNHRSFLIVFAEWSRKIASFLFAILFSVTMTILIVGNLLVETFHNVSARDQIIQQSHLAERSRGLLANFMVSYIIQSEQSQGIQMPQYPLPVWDNVADAILPVEWVEQHLQTNLILLFDWLYDPDLLFPDFYIDFRPVIQSLQSTRGALAILPLMQHIPSCAPNTTTITIMRESLVSCLPRDQDITSIAQAVARWIASTLPGEVSVTRLQLAGMVSPDSFLFLSRIRAGARALDIGLVFVSRLALLFLGFYMLLNSSSPKKLLHSLPLPLIGAGGLSLLLLASVHLVLKYTLTLVTSSLFSHLGSDLQFLIADIIREILQAIRWPWFTSSFLLIIVAVILLLAWLINDRLAKRKQKLPPGRFTQRQRIRKQFR